MHLRVLLRLERSAAIQSAIEAAVTKGASVLDAGCGSGILSIMAARAGAARVLAVDRDNIELARGLVAENGLSGTIEVVHDDLNHYLATAEAGRFDVLLAFIYNNDVILDEDAAAFIFSLQERCLRPGGKRVPDKVRYFAYACEWPARDLQTRAADLERAIRLLEGRYGLRCRTLQQAAWAHMGRDYEPMVRSNPHHVWVPDGPPAHSPLRRHDARLLGHGSAFAEIDYSKPRPGSFYPGTVDLPIASPGVVNGVLWIQELVANDAVVTSYENFSPVHPSYRVDPGERLSLRVDADFRRTNVLARREA